MKPMKLAKVRKHTGRAITVEEAAQYVSPGQTATVTRNQARALSLHSWLNSPTDWLRSKPASCFSPTGGARNDAPPPREADEPANRPGFPRWPARMRAALLNSRHILGPVAYARHMHELDIEERDAKAVLTRAQLRVVAGTALDE